MMLWSGMGTGRRQAERDVDMEKVTMSDFLLQRPYPDESYIKAVWPLAEIDMIHAIKYYRIAVQNATVEQVENALKEAWMIEGWTLNKPGPEVNLFRWALHTAEIEMLFALALKIEGEFK